MRGKHSNPGLHKSTYEVTSLLWGSVHLQGAVGCNSRATSHPGTLGRAIGGLQGLCLKDKL